MSYDDPIHNPPMPDAIWMFLSGYIAGYIYSQIWGLKQ